jgi:hypothetical protein
MPEDDLRRVFRDLSVKLPVEPKKEESPKKMIQISSGVQNQMIQDRIKEAQALMKSAIDAQATVMDFSYHKPLFGRDYAEVKDYAILLLFICSVLFLWILFLSIR